MTPVKKEKTPPKYKYDNRCKVSYPDEILEGIRKWTFRKGISIQDFQRKASEFYIAHLEQTEILTQKQFKK